MSNENDIHFNDPNFHPSKFDPKPLGTQKGMSPEEHKRIVQAGLEKLKKGKLKIGAHEESDVTRILKEAKRRILLVRQYAGLVAHEASGNPNFSRQHLHQEIITKYLENFSHYSKDELHFFLCHFLTELTLNEI